MLYNALMNKRALDPFRQYRQMYKGVFVATKTPRTTKVIAKALDYKTIQKQLEEMGLANEPISVRYLEPKEAICAY